MPRLFRKSYLLNLQNNVDDLAMSVPDRYLPLFWPTLFTLTFALTALTVWLFTARLPVTVEARGLVLPLGGVREIVSFGQGIASNNLKGSDGNLQAGDILLRVSDPTAIAAYQDARRHYQLEESLIAAQQQSSLQTYENGLKKLNMQLNTLRANLARLREISFSLSEAMTEHTVTEKRMLENQQHAAAEIKHLFDDMQEGTDRLREKGVSSERSYIAFQQERTSAQQSLSRVVMDITQSKVQRQRFERELSDIKDQIGKELAQEQELLGALDAARNIRETEIKQLSLGALTRRNELLNAERNLWIRSNIFTPYDGALVAMKKAPGQPVSQGEAVALFNLAPQFRKQMLVISPRAHQGFLKLSLNGRMERIAFHSGDPGIEANLRKALQNLDPRLKVQLRLVGDRIVIGADGPLGVLERLELVDYNLTDDVGVPAFAVLFAIGDDWTAKELTTVAMLRPQDGKRVKPGDLALVKPDFEKSLIGAQLVARVAHVSSYVATSIESQALVGSAEIAQSLEGQSGGVAAILRFEKDAQGERLLDGDQLSRPLTVGALATSRIQVEVASPLEILLPFYANLAN